MTVRPPLTSQEMLREELFSVLKHQRVDVRSLGDELIFIVPSDELFVFHTPRLKPPAMKKLDYVAALLKTYKIVSLSVTGYSADECPERNLALTRQQAANVGDYLWKHELDARILLANGYDGCEPVASNVSSTGRAMNRRIEIRAALSEGSFE